MSARLRWPILLAIGLGLAVGLWVIGAVGFGAVARSVARLGAGGFLLLCLCSLGVNAILGAAWLAAMPGEPWRRLPLFAWARTAREGASDLLPFSQLGGLAVGARTLTRRLLAAPRVFASMIADLTTEMAAQLVFTLFSLWALGAIMLDGDAGRRLRMLTQAGAAVTIALTLAFVLLQRPLLRVTALLARRMLPGMQVAVTDVLAELAGFYRARWSVAAAFLLNLLAWTASAACAWLILRLIGAPLALWKTMALEGLIFTIRSASFLVPGALGLQEAGYVLLAPLFGLAPQAAVSLSLAKRARDLAIGLPALLIWQAIELRAPNGAARA